jgi:uridine monophosphate synthetase
MTFFAKLHHAIAVNRSLLVVALEPNPEMLKVWLQSIDVTDDAAEIPNVMQYQQWLEWLVDQTYHRVAAYHLNLGFYQVLGADGFRLLELILNKIPDSIPVILDAKHSDLNTSSIFAKTIFEQWQVDSVTLNPFAGQDHAAPFLVYPDHAIFVLCHTSNPGAASLQGYPNQSQPLYLELVKQVQSWGGPEQVCLEVGSHDPEVIRQIRAIAPERMILLRSIWAEGSNFKEILRAGFDRNGEGLLIPVAVDLLANPNLGEHVAQLNTTIANVRSTFTPDSACEIWTTDLCLLDHKPHQELILQLFDIGCLLFGEYLQASGATFSYYIDLRKIISNPQLFNEVIKAYSGILQKLHFDRIAGIPYGALPTATGLALALHRPMIYPRKEVKAHGTRRLIEGNFNPGETVVVVDDVLISGKSVMEGADKLKSAGLQVQDIVVFLDHGGEAQAKLEHHGYRAHAVLNIEEITETLYSAGRISQDQYRLVGSGH